MIHIEKMTGKLTNAREPPLIVRELHFLAESVAHVRATR